MTNHLQFDNKFRNQIMINNLKCPPYKMFWLYIRVLEKTGSETTGISENTLYEMSRLSKGIKCAIQGRKFDYNKIKIYELIKSLFFLFIII